MGVKLLRLAEKDDLFRSELAGCFCVCIVYLRTNVKPPLFLANFEKITSFVTHRSYTGGLTFSHDKQNINEITTHVIVYALCHGRGTEEIDWFYLQVL